MEYISDQDVARRLAEFEERGGPVWYEQALLAIQHERRRLAECERERDEARAYADKLVEGLPCLPKDIEVLREANGRFATENERLLAENLVMLEALDEILAQDYLNDPDGEGFATCVRIAADAYSQVSITIVEVARVRALEEVAKAAEEWNQAYARRWVYAFGKRASETTDQFRLAEIQLTTALAALKAMGAKGDCDAE